ncbi:hypothetical protein ACIP1U_10905 [Cupriavidus sp. NPDC089707]|uniref:hypothetical protein n=1 Tax=Cupriavidus sp. NPDC089707 TaxID=3363963 RepID=UPI0038177A13
MPAYPPDSQDPPPPDSSDRPDAAPQRPIPQLWVRAGQSADGAMLEAWLAAVQPMPVPAARARRLMLDALLAQSGRGICLLAHGAAPDDVLACLPVVLVPSLELAGLAALATEWWVRPGLDAGMARACLDASCDTLADWGRAHGIRHALLTPALAGAHGGAPPGFAPHAGGMWLRSLVPAAKVLG